MTPRAARAFWLEQEVVALRGSLTKLTDGNAFKSSGYWSKGFTLPLAHLAPVCTGAAAPCLQDRAGSSGSARKECQRELLGGCGEIDLLIGLAL